MRAAILAFGQLSDPRFRRVLAISLLAAAVLLALLVATTGALLYRLELFGIGWLDALTDLLGGLAAILLALLLFPVVVPIVASFLLDDIAEAVEARHYPGLPPPRRQPATESAWTAIRFAAVAILLNIMVLPLYLLPALNLLVFYVLNGYLLSREYFEMVGLRRLDVRTVRALRRLHGGRLMLAGILIAVLSSIPVLNLLAPIIATAMMVHVLEQVRRQASAGGDSASFRRR